MIDRSSRIAGILNELWIDIKEDELKDKIKDIANRLTEGRVNLSTLHKYVDEDVKEVIKKAFEIDNKSDKM